MMSPRLVATVLTPVSLVDLGGDAATFARRSSNSSWPPTRMPVTAWVT